MNTCLISVRFSDTLVFFPSIDGILLTQFVHEKIWLIMHTFTILVVCQSKNIFQAYWTSSMDIH